ncbi:SCO2524 family protein [Nocardia spumae]|uniref:SCO2524 family protein n=1 Tax=Nocardia spumae TaxID=2887190 RepID=UPI001D13A1A6|nr:SCO2524 family protein [Nocardia spumae]
MRIRPRQQLLDLWQAMVRCCHRDGTWTWGGRQGSNSISDAEQLLCLLYPATEIGAFALDRPNDMPADTRAVLAPLGEPTRVGGVLVGLLEQYLDRYTDAAGEPIFAGGSYLAAEGEQPPTDAQRELEIVDSYSMSVSLCIASLRFLRGFQRFVSGEVRREAKELDARVEALLPGVGARLTAAMTGLVRSFVIHTPPPTTPAGQAILRMLDQTGAPVEEVITAVSARLERVRVQAANDVKLAQTPGVDLADDLLLFECGWSWGVFRDAEPIDFVTRRVADAAGRAEARPYLYFTVVALDGIADLSSQRTRELDLLDDAQRQLADALQLRSELTLRYWSTVARFGTGRWPLEDIPWRTSDGAESDYFSLAIAAMLLQDLVARESTDDLTRTVAVFDQLARRGRIISRLTADDPAAALHHPGVALRLAGSETVAGGPRLIWRTPDFATMMLKRCLQAARLSGDVATRDQLMELAESAMDHVERRVIGGDGPAAGLWDDPAAVVGHSESGAAPPDLPSWFHTERVMECLVVAYSTFREPPLSPATMIARAVELLNEAEHLLNQEMLEVSLDRWVDDHGPAERSSTLTALTRIEQSLDRARRQLRERPGTAFALASQALIQLDELAYARQDARR